MDGAFLEETQCYFGGGTRIALDLGEYREAEDSANGDDRIAPSVTRP
jgi:hypothetical protein